MITHEDIWDAINVLAVKHGFSMSGLAKESGLDATSFNKSKHFNSRGQPRYPSTESIIKILKATNTSFTDFSLIVENKNDTYR
jgi:DNA-binding phage protein